MVIAPKSRRSRPPATCPEDPPSDVPPSRDSPRRERLAHAACCLQGPARATLSGIVTHVADGDTLDITANGQTCTIRLDGIDAPEEGQAFGREARVQSRVPAFSKPATATVLDRDRYGRTVARVIVAGRDLSEEMVRAGLAWHLVRYSADRRLAALRNLNDRGFLDEFAPLRLVRIQGLLRQWKAVCVRPPREIKMRWLIPGKPGKLLRALRRYEARGRLLRLLDAALQPIAKVFDDLHRGVAVSSQASQSASTCTRGTP
jgi:endonuclease YncB( thermonuclease family)